MAENTARIVLTAEDKTGAALANLRRGLSDVTNQASALQSAFRNLAPVLTFAGLATGIKSINDGVDALNDLKDATGASISNISALEDIGARTGTSFDTVSSSLVKFNQALADSAKNPEVAAAFKAINLNAEELKKLDPAEALRRTAVALSEFADDGNKARLVQELFGRSVKEVAPFLKDLATQTELVGKVTGEQADEAERFNKILFELKKNSTDAARSFTAELIPALSNLSQELAIGSKSAGGFFNAITTLGTNNPFRTQAENIRAYSEELAKFEQTRKDYLERGFSTAAIDADIADVRVKLDYLKKLQQEAALAGSDGNQSGAESRRLGLSGGGAKSVGNIGSGLEEAAKKSADIVAKAIADGEAEWQKELNEAQRLGAEHRLRNEKELLEASKEEQRQYFEWIDQQREEDDRKAREAAGIFDDQAAGMKKATSAAQELGLTFSSAFEDAVIGGGKTRDILQGILDDILRITLRRNVTEKLESAIGSINFGSLFGGGDTSSVPIDGYAKGGVFDDSSLSAFSGGVFSTPQFFAFAKGAGVFGEAGPEAIMPLTRTPSGELGVRAAGGGSMPKVEVHLHESAGGGGRVSQSMDGDTMVIDVLVEQIGTKLASDITRGRGSLPSAMEGTYGLSRSPGSY